MSMTGERLPYPGLRSFTREETDLFFGREGCVDDMVDRLAAARFLAVLGASGSGKSSLVKTGLLDALEIGLLHQAGSRWVIADFRPGDRPIYNMAEGLIKATSPDPNAQPDEEEVKLLRAFLARGPRSVVEWCEDGSLPEGANLLLLVDQFEELFRYGAYAEREEAEAFVSLLLESARAPLGEARIYVAITMRSEFLGAAALIDGLAEAINKGLYLTPRMSRDQVRDAIVGPAAVCGFTIEPALVNRLLNDLTSFAPWEEGDTGHQLERLVRRADQLPLMQHVLNRLWSIAAGRSGGNAVVLRLADYDRLGGLRGALAAHGREILDELLPEHREIASAVFRALTAGSSLAEAVRRPTEFGELVAIAGGDEIAVREIVEAFRAPGRNFLVPARPTALRPNTLIDISHESLIRQWDEFAQWLQREITSADTWRRLVDAADRYKRNEANLIAGLTLASIANWWDTERPTATWAKRYGGDFAAAADFLAESRRAEAAEKAHEAEDRRQKSRNRLVTAAVIVVLCIITPLTGFAGYMAYHASQEALAAEAARASAVLLADEAKRAAESEAKARADAERLADEARKSAEAEALARADAERLADEARKSAEAEALARSYAERLAEQAREASEVARQQTIVAEQAAELAREESARADEQSRRAESARAAFQGANLEQFAGRLTSLQQSAAWETAANLLGAFWQEISGPDKSIRESWMVAPVIDAFARQKFAEYPVYPAFLSYSGFTGWTGTYGRFRVYDLDRKAADGSTEAGNNIMGVFDAVTGAVTGTFELPDGLSLGSEIDLVSPDGRRAVVVTSDPNADDTVDERQVAVWVAGQPSATLIPMPDLGGDVDVAGLSLVNTDDRLGLYFTLDSSPGIIEVVDPAAGAASFAITTADLAAAAGLESVSAFKLLGLADDRLVALVNNDVDGRVLAINVSDSAVQDLVPGGGVLSAALSPDGAILLTITCPEPCDDQDLTAFDARRNNALWRNRVPAGFTFAESGIEETTVDGAAVYSVAVQNRGAGIIFQVPKDHPEQVTRLASETTSRIDEIVYDGEGGYRTVDSTSGEASVDGVEAAGVLASYRIPSGRQKLSYYVAPNSIAVYEDGDTVRLAGVTYSGDLVVYRLRDDGQFEDDPDFLSVPVGESDCVAAIGFGGDGNSLLIRHIDGYLRYVVAIGKGPNVDWREPIDSAAASVVVPAMQEPSTDCEPPEASGDVIRERIVPVDRDGKRFALLDRRGAVYWADIIDDEEDLQSAGGGEATIREIDGLKFVNPSSFVACPDSSAPTGEGPRRLCARPGLAVTWIAGDAAGGRAALASAASVDILPYGVTTTTTVREVRPEASATSGGGTRSVTVDASGAARQPEGPQKLTRRGEAKAVAFDGEGNLVVVYADGQLVLFAEADGAWSNLGEIPVPRAPVDTLTYSGGRILLADDKDFVLGVDAAAKAITGYGRAPANPSAFAMLPEGRVLSIEWDTDSVSTVDLAALPTAAEIDEAARLVTMRSTLRHEDEPSLDALLNTHQMEMELSLVALDGAKPVDCRAEERRYLSVLERTLFGDGAVLVAEPQLPSECSGGVDARSLQAADVLAQRARIASIRQLVEDGAFSVVLQGAAADDSVAKSILGAVLTRIAIERGELDRSAIARDAIRFGTDLPSTIMKAFAAGAPIEDSLVEIARQAAGDDPAVHQLIAHWDERRINDIEALTDALLEFSIAERLYRAEGQDVDADFVALRRAQLARILPDERVLDVVARVEKWQPPASAPTAAVELPDLPADTAARHMLDMENAERILSDSPLLEGLRTELERARILDLRDTDPETAASMLIDLGRRTGGEGGWSPDLVREYLTLAEDIGSAAAPSAFQLASEAMRIIGLAFKAPIHADAEASELFRRAADVVAANVAAIPRETVASAMDAIDLSLVKYDYGNLPGIGVEAEVTAGEQILESTARMAEAVAGTSDDPSEWNWLRGESLFWEGVLVNDHDPASAGVILKQSADIIRPLVEASGDDQVARFRLAEVLRWAGFAEPSNPETEAIEREALDRYQALWTDPTLDPTLVGPVGLGYGFALANFGQTIREMNLADLSDGRSAEDHVAWFLEVLALAKEKDDLNAALIERGAATGDSGFVVGWYGMSSYGWAVGFLSGLVNVERGNETVTQCDVLAADPYDPRRRAFGEILDQIDAANAETVCRAESVLHPEDSRTLYQLARLMSADMTREGEFMPLARAAAERGSSAAFSIIAYELGEKKDDRSGSTYVATTQHTILESFPILFPFLEGYAKTERERTALAWYARKAADLGMPEAQLAMARLATDPVQKLFHTKLAERLFGEQGQNQAAANARRLSTAIFVGQAEAAQVDADVAAWTAESLIELPADVGAS